MIEMVLLALGLILLVTGAELLVRGASRLASALGISPLIIGLTVVAYGTSAPELAVSVRAAFAGQADLSIGNVVGSNVFNVLFILGASALITPLVVSQQLVRWDVPIMIGVSALVFLLARDGVIGSLDGAVLVSGAAFYTWLAVRQSRRESRQVRDEYEREFGGPPSRSAAAFAGQGVLIAIGLVLLVLGSHWLVDGAVFLARAAGVSELVVGLTVVAAGTSLPEVATSIVAAIRGERDIAVGNVVGSNIFNVLCVLGAAGLVAPGGIPVSGAVRHFDLPVMLAVAFACLPIFFTGHRIARWEGALLLGYYAAYTTYLVLAATKHDMLPAFSSLMFTFVIPLTAATLAIVTWRSWRAGRE